MLKGLSGLAHRPRKEPQREAVDKWTVRADARSGPLAVDNAYALPTARASAHLTTACHHDAQGTLLEEPIVLVLEDTRRHLGRAENEAGRQTGSFSKAEVPRGSFTQEWRLQSYIDNFGAGKFGSANAPTATPTPLTSPSSVWNRFVPQTGQNLKVNFAPWSPTRTYSVALPVTLYGAPKLASAANTLPVRR